MERRTPARNVRQQRAHQHGRQQNNSLTQQQVLVLIVVGLLNIALLGLAGFALLGSEKPPVVLTLAKIPATSPSSFLPPTWTPAPTATRLPTQDVLLTPQLGALPVGCADITHPVIQGTVTRVLDARSLEISANGVTFQAAYAGIRPPVLEEQAVREVRSMAEGRPVILVQDTSDQDEAGRLVRYIFTGGRFLNYELVRLGLASADLDSPDQACRSAFQQAEQLAQVARAGMWRPTPVPTRTFMPLVTVDPSGNSGCDCSIRYECSDFRTRSQAQTCYNVCNDYSSKLDEDRDGLACEYLP